MCGIFGYLKLTDGKITVKERHELFKLFIKTQHRGPEHSVFKNIKNNTILGFHRLSIVSIKHGTQPFHNKDETVFCICNGEIYNYAKLIKMHYLNTADLQTGSDCEVIYALYMKYGLEYISEIIASLDGVYSFCIIDLREEEPLVIMARDPFGIRSLYYSYDNNKYRDDIKDMYYFHD